jgi:hypothetical protein
MHGISQEPMPAVSSYVGYSLEEPWGEPRVVFGIEASEAEQFAALLDRHDCAGPVYAGLASMPGARPEQSQEFITATDLGRVVVPSQAQPTVAEREAAWREATWREAAPREQEPRPSPDQQMHGGPLESAAEPPRQPSAAAARRAPETADDEEAAAPDTLAPDDAEPGLPAFRPQADPASYAGEDQDQDDDPPQFADQADQLAERAEPAQAPRVGRSRGHALTRPRRSKPSAGK